jgi:hypothetical protein
MAHYAFIDENYISITKFDIAVSTYVVVAYPGFVNPITPVA